MSTPPKTVKTRICIISDTHAEKPRSTDSRHPYRVPLPSSDILLHAGDLTHEGLIKDHQITFDVIKEADAGLKLVIAGNHDVTLDRGYCGTWASKGGEEEKDAVKELWTGEEARRAGIVYLEEGVKNFELKNGGKFTIYTSPYTPEFCDWSFAYERHEDRYNKTPLPSPSTFHAPNSIPSWPAVDIVMTHGPPYNVLDLTTTGIHAGCDNLRKAIKRCRPRLHCFGHIHEGRGAERHSWVKIGTVDKIPTDEKREVEDGCSYIDVSKGGDGGEGEGDRGGNKPLMFGEETLFVNASTMNAKFQPNNAPWVVDLDLPVVRTG